MAYKAPLYGRRTAQIKLLPFDFEDTARCFPRFSPEDKALVYGIAGGTPQYLLQMDDRLSIAENIMRTFLNPVSFLFEEPEKSAEAGGEGTGALQCDHHGHSGGRFPDVRNRREGRR